MSNDKTIKWYPQSIAEGVKSPIAKRVLLHSFPGDLGWGDYESLSITSVRENGCPGPSVCISWIPLTPEIRSPRVEMFCDTWLAFTELRDIFDALSGLDAHILEDQSQIAPNIRRSRFELSPERVKNVLISLGIEEKIRPFPNDPDLDHEIPF